MRLLELFEQLGKTVAVAFGRMNPPTIGHQKVVDAVLKQKADAHFLFVSQTHKPTGKNKTRLENPLPFDIKLGFIEQAFPNIDIGDTSVGTAIGILQSLEKQGFENVIFVCGSDRVPAFTELFNKQNGIDYNLKSIKIESSGARDPDAEGAEGMSASKMRAAAIADDFDAFKTGLPAGLQGNADEVFSAVRQGLEPWFEQGVAEGVPQPGPSSGAPKQFGPDAKIQTRQMTVKDIISSIPGVPYYNNVVDDWDAKDYSWNTTEKVIEYATYLKDHPESLAKLPPIIVLNGKFEDGAHRVSAIWLLQQRMDPKNPLWKNAKLNVQFVKQGVAEGSQEINWVKPNFDFEWHEVEEQSRMKQVPVDVRQYYQKHFPNKDAWLKAVQNGKAVVVPPDHAYEIRNAPFDKASLQKVLAPTGHEGPIGPAKEKRVNDLFDKGQVEMPIILKTSQGLWLIGGKTRLGTANYVKGLPAKVWLISGEQGVAEGPTDDSRFQKMMGKIQKSTPTPMSGYVALSFASEGRSKKIKGVKHNGKPMPDVIDDPEEFLGGKIEFTPDQIEQELMSIGEKYGWDSIDPGQGQGYTEMFFDTSREYTSNNQSRLAANIVRTVNEINKFFNSINRSLQSTGLPGYTADVWQGMGPPDNINQIEDLTQITSIAKKQDVEESSLNEFDPGEDGFGPFKVYVDDDFIEKFSTFDQAKEEIEFLRTADPKSFDADWKIIDGTGKTVWQHDPGEAIDAMRMRRKLQFIKPDEGVEEASLGSVLQWPEVVNKVSSAMKATGWKGKRMNDDAFMFTTRGAEVEDQWYIAIIDNAGDGFFKYALGTVEEGDPHIDDAFKGKLPNTEASVSELMDEIRDGFGLD